MGCLIFVYGVPWHWAVFCCNDTMLHYLHSAMAFIKVSWVWLDDGANTEVKHGLALGNGGVVVNVKELCCGAL